MIGRWLNEMLVIGEIKLSASRNAICVGRKEFRVSSYWRNDAFLPALQSALEIIKARDAYRFKIVTESFDEFYNATIAAVGRCWARIRICEVDFEHLAKVFPEG